MFRLVLVIMVTTTLAGAPQEISFPTSDGGLIFADVYGSGDKTIVLAHGARFNKASWEKQANDLAKAGFRVVAIDFRGYGKSRGGSQSNSMDAMYLDVLGAAAYLRNAGAKSIAVIGASMGGAAAANAVVKGKPGDIDRLVLLAPAPVDDPGRISGPKLYVTGRGDPIATRVRDQYEKAPEPKELLLLDSSAHAQFLFTTDQGERLMKEIIRFLSATATAAH